MAIKGLDPSLVEASQTELRERFLSGSLVSSVNLDSIAALSRVERFEFPRGSKKWFGVPSVSYVDGIKMKELYDRIIDAGKYGETMNRGVYQLLVKQVLDLAWSMCKPESFIWRVRKKLGLLRNPFHRMSEGEASQLLGFFLVRRMTSSVEFGSPTTPVAILPST